MKEALFVKQNIEKWQAAEQVAESAVYETPDTLADTYMEITTDLAFAQTHYAKSRTTQYLNALAFALHNSIYKNKREQFSRIITFWTHEVPQTMWEARHELRLSLFLLLLFALIGVISTLGDPDFPRIILGNGYVDMTLENIAKGEPMAVYDNEAETTMFLGITLNNVMVSFRVFAMGMLTSFGTAYILLANGIMVGAFQTFMFQHGVGWESVLAIWLHGTIEMSSIVVAGAGGLALGNAWLFPGTFRRWESFRRGARRGLKIVVGTVPLFIIAGFIESFVTRHTNLPDLLRLGIILISAAFVLFYFVWLPRRIHLKAQQAAPTSATSSHVKTPFAAV